MSKNIIFIGFMGVGKSCIGQKIAQELGCLFVDTDNLIENSQFQNTKEIFNKYGEKYFRDLEKKVYDFLIPTSNLCISLGGGFPIHINKNIKDLGLVVYLQKPLEDIIKSLDKKEIQKRPLLSNIKDATKLYNERLDIYIKNSDLTINVNGIDFDKISQEVLTKIKPLI
jgi:shikimate kinase